MKNLKLNSDILVTYLAINQIYRHQIVLNLSIFNLGAYSFGISVSSNLNWQTWQTSQEAKIAKNSVNSRELKLNRSLLDESR